MAKVVSKARPARLAQYFAGRLDRPACTFLVAFFAPHALPGDRGADRSAAYGQNGARSGRLIYDQMPRRISC
jgi:hypothetical protein